MSYDDTGEKLLTALIWGAVVLVIALVVAAFFLGRATA